MYKAEQLFRLSAFSDSPHGGNPAGVWIGEQLPDAETMQRIAAEVGYSETAFIAPGTGAERQIRYYSPLAEVSFCGHATIATGVVLAKTSGAGTYRLHTSVGEVTLETEERDGKGFAKLTSVATEQRPIPAARLAQYLDVIGWHSDELDMSLPAIFAFAGAWHLVLACQSQSRLDNLAYDFNRLQTLMLEDGLATLQLIWREHSGLYHSRNPFPVGGVVEDPATGAAAAALGGYLRDHGLIKAPMQFEIQQGVRMGRPSQLNVSVPVTGGVSVTGTAVELAGD
ncbi:PhzF family phenazine biosynthesis protein [Bowmanella denitrificans]|uniref:PhzF family phenazine biosynthesis protein n=1 Tax=Bowmanella denitrificans TaxID=366582 RepID=UPI000C9C2110|nr:PhzF family phenazine biosynthesis isomerase [Bowmanella denitrificans]